MSACELAVKRCKVSICLREKKKKKWMIRNRRNPKRVNFFEENITIEYRQSEVEIVRIRGHAHFEVKTVFWRLNLRLTFGSLSRSRLWCKKSICHLSSTSAEIRTDYNLILYSLPETTKWVEERSQFIIVQERKRRKEKWRECKDCKNKTRIH